MPPISQNEIIDLCSSPPSSIRVRTRSQSRARSVGQNDNASEASKPSNSKASVSTKNAKGRKGKGKQPLRTLGPVIELTDSEDEKEGGKTLTPAAMHRGENQPSSSTSRLASGSGNASSSNLNDEQATRNVMPDLDGGPSRASIPDPGKGKARETPVEEVVDIEGSRDLLYGGEAVVGEGDNIEPRNVDNPEQRPPIAGPSNQLATVLAPAAPLDPMAPLEPEPVSEPAPVADPPTQALTRILEVVPNVDPEFLYPLIAAHLPNFGDDPTRTAAFIVDTIFEMGDKVPKVNVKGKRKIEGGEGGAGSRGEGKEQADNGDERQGKKVKVDWASVDRPFAGTGSYLDLALILLQTSFPHMPKRYLRRQLTIHNSHYAPTHLYLLANEKAQKKEYEPKLTRYNPEKDRARLLEWNDPVLEEERAWIVERGQEEILVEEGGKDKGKGKAKAVDGNAEEEPELEDGEGIECQCCFCEYPFAKMVQCPEAHLFCTTCISQYASTQLGSHCATLVCMHSSECKQPFPESELRRVLDCKLMDLYDRVKQQKEIEDAGLEDLEECPFCEWKCEIEASKEQEKLFRCGNEEGGCGVVSCRMCKKEDHLPKSCKEVEEDKHLDSQHVIEEAMTQALMRQCPKCKKPFIKEAGCNKMSCPHCRTLSCYICRQIINGYDHFDQTPPNAASSSRKSGKCLLWDSVEQRHADEVKAAAEKALADFKKNNPDADPSGIKVDIPKAPPAPAGHAGPGGIHYHVAYNQNVNNIGYFAAMNAYQHGFQQMAQPQAGVWAGMPVPLPVAQPPVPVVLPPAPVPRRGRGPALVAQARRAGAGRRRGANPAGPRIARHAANARPDPPPIPYRRATQPGLGIPPAPPPQNQFHFGLQRPAGLLQQQPLYGMNANVHAAQQQQQQQQQQLLQEAFNVNERLRQNDMARQGLAHGLDGRAVPLDDWRGDAGVRAPVPIDPLDDEHNQWEQRLHDAQQRVLRERMALMQEHHRRMMEPDPLRMYQPELPGGVGVGNMPAMGYHAALGVPMVPQYFGGPQYQTRK